MKRLLGGVQSLQGSWMLERVSPAAGNFDGIAGTETSTVPGGTSGAGPVQ